MESPPFFFKHHAKLMQRLLRLIGLTSLILFASGLVIAAAPSPARKAKIPAFEGTAKIQFTHERVGTHIVNYSVKDSRLRTEFQVSESAHAVAIADLFNDEVLVLLPGQPLYVTMSLEDSAELAFGHGVDEVVIEKTRARQKILGYRCTKYIARHKNDSFEIWATEQLGSFMGLSLERDGAKFQPAWLDAFIGKGFFPMRVHSLPGSSNALSMETIAVQRESLPETLFTPPAGYRKFNMGGIVHDLLGKL